MPSPEPLKPGEGVFSRCQPGESGGGYDLWIKAISCQEAQKWIVRFLPTFNLPHREGLGRLEDGWECITERTGRRGDTYRRVCAREEQLIVFSQSP